MSHNQEIGKFGENLAKNYLIRHGYEVVDLNVKLSYQELDIVARRRGLIVFVEVKTRISQIYGPAVDAFAQVKSARFKKAIEMYLIAKKIFADNIRADLIAVDINRVKKTAKIKHYKDII
ncbi:MAG: YraN family protein [Patescibacteria group bacterium]|nr:YraN family protein [Patescibacteria group bacterium]